MPDVAYGGVLVLVVLILTAGALLSAAGYAVFVGLDVRRISRMTERLAVSGPSAVGRGESRRIRDPRLRRAFERLAAHLTETWTLATTDLLTQVLNRQALLIRLDEELQRAGRYGRQLSIILLDLDHFKRLNDSHGHQAGDLVLSTVARTLRDTVRSIDIVGRWGGEEFMVVLPETDVDAAASLAEKLRRVTASRRIELADGNRATITLSAGVAGGSGSHLRLDAIVRDADAALYSAKALGRDQVYVFHEVEEDLPVRRAAIAPEAREAAIQVGRAALEAATEALESALTERAPWAGRPSMLIEQGAIAMARSMGLPEREVERIRVASLLHDLGKLAIPDDILEKAARLIEPEWRVVAEHPKIGQVVLEQAGALRDAATIVLHHHEWFDGRGYPHGLSGEEIPVGARIVAIVDAYEAMIAGRPYRPAITHEAALDELRRHAGIQFDPQLVDQFVTLFADGVPWAPGSVAPEIQAASEGTRQAAALAADHDRLHARRRQALRTPGDRAPDAERAGSSDAQRAGSPDAGSPDADSAGTGTAGGARGSRTPRARLRRTGTDG